MKYALLFLFAVTLFQSCSESKTSVKNESNPLNEEVNNSHIYKRERRFTFLASHFDSTGKLSAIDTVFLTTNSKIISEKYGQTWSSWASTVDDFGDNYTGITEHDTAVWIHPPRTGRYKKLELSPFPMVEYPLKAGNTWTWDLLVPSYYGIDGFAEWADNTNERFISTYKINRILPVSTNMGTLDCFEIDGFTKSIFDRTELKSYFNSEYGFVKLEYKNIDKSRLVMELQNVRYAQSGTQLPFKDLKI